MMRALLAFAVVSGCAFEPGSFPETIGDEATGDGSGSQGGDDQDTDGDGLLDVVDNCAAVGNTDQRDHDDDARGDACDPCPHVMDTGKDADGDGVGDACDPRPTEPGDRIAFFEGFYNTVDWHPAVGANTWLLDAGTLHQPEVESQHQLVRDDDPDLGSVAVDMRVRINQLSTNATSRRSMGVVLAYHDDEDYLFCGLSAQGTGSKVNAGQVDTDFWGTPRFTYNESAFAPEVTGEWLTVQARTVRLDSSTTRIECATHRAGITANTVYDAETGVAGDVGIRTNGTDASFDYVFVVELGAPSP